MHAERCTVANKFIRVQEVTPDKVIVTVKDPKDRDAKPVTKEIPAGFVLWSTGIGESGKGSLEARSARLTTTSAMQPFTKRLVDILPNQYHSKAVEVDSFLRVQGAPKGTVYALGDAATVNL